MQEAANSTPEKLIVEGRFSGFTPSELFDYWVKPELMAEWWAPIAAIEPVVGGQYLLSWPDMGWHMRGVFTEVMPGESLGFTWKWDHGKQDLDPLNVHVTFKQDENGGTDLTIEHGPFGPEDHDDRQGILEGWIHFGMRLAGLRESTG